MRLGRFGVDVPLVDVCVGVGADFRGLGNFGGGGLGRGLGGGFDF